MSSYYNAQRSRNLYDPQSAQPFKLSRSKIADFLNCPRCFYLDRRRGVARPPGYPFSLNVAVDALLKKEFDAYRERGEAHPLMIQYGVEAVPFAHKDLPAWRENFQGIQALHGPTQFLVTGAIDDLWVNAKKELIVVEYKATAKAGEITALDKDWQEGYKRQMEIYQWLFRKNGFAVSDTGYFVYCNGKADREDLSGRLEFDVTLIPYTGASGWVDPALLDISACLKAPQPPAAAKECDYCAYAEALKKVDGDGISS